MLASHKGMGRSGLTSTTLTNKSGAAKKDNFIVFIFKKIMAMTSYMWSRGKSFLWVGSTGTLWGYDRLHFIDFTLQFCLFDGVPETGCKNHGRYDHYFI